MITVWVLARAGDAGLPALEPAPPGVTYVVGDVPEHFAGAPPADALFVCSLGRRKLEPVFPLAKGLRWVHSRSAGIEKLLFPALVESPIPLTNGKGVFSASLAEWAIGAVLYFAKDFRRLVRLQGARRWEEFAPEMMEGRTLGIVGYGDIGRATATRARALGMKILALRRRPEESRQDTLADEVLSASALPSLLERSDYVVVAMPLTPETHHLLGRKEIGHLRASAVLINLGRGAVIDEKELAQALGSGRLKGAALDVFEEEPLPAQSPLWGMENVLLSPHCADQTVTWLEDASRAFLQNLERFRRGEPLRNVVDKRRGY
ncbi:MAG TPA: D-2-hydroxyacid dehydrogenase [Vicinamibacteria bacterium]|jgi:phosphoglycerate dehydrogenase-like enzyme